MGKAHVSVRMLAIPNMESYIKAYPPIVEVSQTQLVIDAREVERKNNKSETKEI